jgi:hypothetical protein
MDERDAGCLPLDKVNCRAALVHIHALALRGLAQANTELTLADGEGDSERWSLWRGYRRAMLEVLAVTENLGRPAAEPARPQDGACAGAVSGEAKCPGARPA